MTDKTKLSKYEILEELGRGGFGVVYKARDTVLDRIVAVKVLHPNLVNDLSFVSRFRNEARLAAQLDHPNIVPVHDFGESEGLYYIVLGYMPGGSLKEMLQKEGALPEEKALTILRQIANGLSYANHKGIIHRDLKPGNILFDELGEARVSDLGFAKLLHSDSSASLTMSGGVVGTPAYMAPEIWKGLPATPAVDVYSSACIFVEMLTGKQLFEGDSTPVIMLKHFQPVSLPENLPEHWKPVILKALSQEPENRYSDLSSFIYDLEHPAPLPELEPETVHVLEDVKSTDTLVNIDIETEPKDTKKPISEEKSASSTTKQSRTPLMVGLGIGALTIVLLLFFLLIDRKEKPAFSYLPTQTPVVTIKVEIPTKTSSRLPIQTSTQSLSRTPTLTPTHYITHTPTTRTLGIGSTITRKADGMEMVYVPAGEFIMGSENGKDDEKPVREVYLDAYWIDKYEVSNAQYTQCVDEGICTDPSRYGSFSRGSYYTNPDFDNYPVIFVNWQQAQIYCKWAGGSLPTEAQWEKAARGSNGQTYPWGEESPNCHLANKHLCTGDTRPVNYHNDVASPYGAYNMIGNVLEWVQDWYGPYEEEENKNPIGPSSGTFKVLRGGSWSNDEFSLHGSRRYSYDSMYAVNNFGFRCVFPED